MDLLVLLSKVVAGVGGLLLFVYVLYRVALAARKAGQKGSGGVLVGVAMMFVGVIFAPIPPPPPEIRTESREMRLKRNEDDGDPPEPGSSTGTKRLNSAKKVRPGELIAMTERKVE